MTKEKVIDKIQKLFALANDNKNPNEAFNALTMAKKLMEEFQIEEFEVQQNNNQKFSWELDNNTLICDTKIKTWESMLAHTISQLFEVKAILFNGAGFEFVKLHGDKLDVAIASQAYFYASNWIIERVTQERIPLMDYFVGFNKGLLERINERKNDNNNPYAIVSVEKLNWLEKEFNALYPNRVSGKSSHRKVKDINAFNRGISEGKHFNFSGDNKIKQTLALK